MFKVAWKNIMHRPLTLTLNILLLSLGVGLMSFLFTMNDQLKEKFDKNLADIDLVIGAKGSPLQMILCNMYHIDNPTGNISVEEAMPYLRPKNPIIKQAMPLSLGDSYQGYRIVGTEKEFIDLYDGEISEGKMFSYTLEATIGATVAKESDLKIGSVFKSSHGFIEDEDMTHDHGQMKVVGILKPSGSVMDQLILTPTSSVWAAHDHVEEVTEEAHDHEGHDHEGHDHEGHDHGDHEGHDHGAHDHSHDTHVHDGGRADLLSHPEKEITALLIKYVSRTNIHALNLPRFINNDTDMMAASPPIEINRLYSMMGTGTRALQILGFLIALVSGISIFISLLNSLKERAYELSLLRVSGASPTQLFSLVIFEGLILSFIGAILGLIFGRVAMYFMAERLGVAYGYEFGAGIFGLNDVYILIAALVLGFLASIIPASRAYGIDIHKVLSGK